MDGLGKVVSSFTFVEPFFCSQLLCAGRGRWSSKRIVKINDGPKREVTTDYSLCGRNTEFLLFVSGWLWKEFNDK